MASCSHDGDANACNNEWTTLHELCREVETYKVQVHVFFVTPYSSYLKVRVLGAGISGL
ncbi:predicted protein [Sclerotinia sclerotiorum 1980 UF-70]|uniref:Uncharacterized protein n=1 Tax=Sclerotinia sclerotiorum (strain ATCC 18683 / 1980 / Ss-1) TaxID=665079 RepID=A7F8V7_SCLS1|nr:predicted protein [Sclerotinia sclerotiorum 1980 UF-70]EDN99178.1 predicted protein [Sclerotinia sclerotiorum 1980 UF-70]